MRVNWTKLMCPPRVRDCESCGFRKLKEPRRGAGDRRGREPNHSLSRRNPTASSNTSKPSPSTTTSTGTARHNALSHNPQVDLDPTFVFGASSITADQLQRCSKSTPSHSRPPSAASATTPTRKRRDATPPTAEGRPTPPATPSRPPRRLILRLPARAPPSDVPPRRVRRPAAR